MKKINMKSIFISLFRILALCVCITAITLQLFTNKIIGKGFMANHVLAYFTIQTNILSGMLFLYLILKTIILSIKKKEIMIATINPSIQTAITLYITITMAVYWIVLAPMLGIPSNALSLSNTLFLHLFTPIFTIVDYILICEHGKLNKYDPLKWLAYPIFYLILIIIIANVSNIPYYKFPFKGENVSLMFPYPFLDPQIVGIWGKIFIIFFLFIIFLALAYFLVFIDNKISKYKSKKLQKIN